MSLATTISPTHCRIVTTTVQTLADGNNINHPARQATRAAARQPENRHRSPYATMQTAEHAHIQTTQKSLTTAPLPDPQTQQATSSSVEKLGGQTINGVYAEGTRITLVIRAGTQGNDRDFTVISEHWKSTKLGIEVLDKTTDPRTGETTRETKNLSRAEPDPALFQIPPDYTLQTSQQPSQDHP